MSRAELKQLELTELDLDRARWHMMHGTKEFRDFLALGDHLEILFAKWLQDNCPKGRATP